MRLTLPVSEPTEGRVAVSGSVLAHVLSTLPPGATITLSAVSGHLEVVSVSGTSRITLQDVGDFPTLPQVTDGTEFDLPVREIRDVVSSVAYCASTSSIKPELASVFVHLEGSVITAAATDSFRLAEKRVPLKKSITVEPFLIPARTVSDMVRVLEHAGDTASFVVGKHQLSVSFPGTYLTLRLTNGTFPDYGAIIPKQFASEVTVLRHDLERSLKKAAVFSDQFNKITLTISPRKKTFTVHAANSVVGDTTDSVPASLTGEEITISFNGRYLVDALQPISSESVVLRFAGTSQAAVVSAVGDDTFKYLVMPMNR
jgi:DNA polymerase-3 subunit beta